MRGRESVVVSSVSIFPADVFIIRQVLRDTKIDKNGEFN